MTAKQYYSDFFFFFNKFYCKNPDKSSEISFLAIALALFNAVSAVVNPKNAFIIYIKMVYAVKIYYELNEKNF